MKTTLNKIKHQSPCQDGWVKLLKHLGKTEADDEPLSLITILDSNGLDDALWCLRAVDGQSTKDNLAAAGAAAAAAGDVAWAAWAVEAARAAEAAAWDAAWAAGDAAWAAAWAVGAVGDDAWAARAAGDAAWAAARAEQEKELRRICAAATGVQDD
jgi:hypothetical protein